MMSGLGSFTYVVSKTDDGFASQIRFISNCGETPHDTAETTIRAKCTVRRCSTKSFDRCAGAADDGLFIRPEELAIAVSVSVCIGNETSDAVFAEAAFAANSNSTNAIEYWPRRLRHKFWMRAESVERFLRCWENAYLPGVQVGVCNLI
jgi:hypothetical protein